MITRKMKQAMSTLSTFSEKDQHYYQYQARQEYLREQRTIQHKLEQARRALLHASQREELALQEKQSAQQREELALAEIERLKSLLAKKM
jgi:type VI protein secretion system component VasF